MAYSADKRDKDWFNSIIDLALTEDVSHGDVTSEALIPPELHGKASILVKDRGILAGSEVARGVFLRVDPSLKVDLFIKDGAKVKPGDIIATVSGKVINILNSQWAMFNLSRCIDNRYSVKIHETNLVFVKY